MEDIIPILDVIIPTRNAEQDLSDCLWALKAQTIPIRVLIVDARSTDGTVQIATEHGVTVILEPPSNVKGSRRAVACNEGLKHSTAPLIGFIDSDTIVPERWAEDLTQYILNDHNVGAVTSGCVSQEIDPLSRVISMVMKVGSTHARNFKNIIKIDSCPGYNSIYRRAAIDWVGGFSEDIGGCEDWELNLRIRRVEWDVIGVPESPVEHRERRSLRSFARQMWGYGWSRGRLLRVKHIFTPLHIMPSLALLSLFILPLIFPNIITVLVIDILLCIPIVLLLLGMGTGSGIKGTLLILVVFVTQQLSWAVGYVVGLVASRRSTT